MRLLVAIPSLAAAAVVLALDAPRRRLAGHSSNESSWTTAQGLGLLGVAPGSTRSLRASAAT